MNDLTKIKPGNHLVLHYDGKHNVVVVKTSKKYLYISCGNLGKKEVTTKDSVISIRKPERVNKKTGFIVPRKGGIIPHKNSFFQAILTIPRPGEIAEMNRQASIKRLKEFNWDELDGQSVVDIYAFAFSKTLKIKPETIAMKKKWGRRK